MVLMIIMAYVTIICATVSLAVNTIHEIRHYRAMIAKMREEELRRKAIHDWMKALETREPVKTESVRIEWIEK